MCRRLEMFSKEKLEVITQAKLFLDPTTVESAWMILIPTIQLTNLQYNYCQKYSHVEVFAVIMRNAFVK